MSFRVYLHHFITILILFRLLYSLEINTRKQLWFDKLLNLLFFLFLYITAHEANWIFWKWQLQIYIEIIVEIQIAILSTYRSQSGYLSHKKRLSAMVGRKPVLQPWYWARACSLKNSKQMPHHWFALTLTSISRHSSIGIKADGLKVAPSLHCHQSWSLSPTFQSHICWFHEATAYLGVLYQDISQM